MMEKIDKGHPMSQSIDFVAQNIETLKTLFPTIVKEGKIDMKELQALLGDEVETEDEYYRFTWAGKSMARREANKPSTATLRLDKASSKDWDTTKNIFIEGDNLEVLKLLQKSYANKIKFISIDPPYNTGEDFVYKDNYNDNLGNYLTITGQTDEEGKRVSTNSESDGRYHSNWLNMMYPRLKLARNLLTDDGLIFISIADEECYNLKKVCDEIFGENNFKANFLWRKKTTTSNVKDAQVSPQVDYILCYSKSDNSKLKQRITPVENRSYPETDSEGNYRLAVIEKKDSGSYKRDTMKFPICGHLPREGKRWQIGIDTAKELEAKNRFIWDGEKIKLKIYDFEDTDTFSAQPNLLIDKGTSDIGAKEVNEVLFGIPELFDNPKPVQLIQHLLNIQDNVDSIILDFFAGSGTTAHAVIQSNSEDAGNRKFICVQLPEPTDEKSEAYKAGYKTISEITKERIRRAGKKIKSEIIDDLFSKEGKSLDVGFRAFKLDSSNIRAWDGNPDALEDNLLNAGKNIKENRTEEDVLYEILLKYGLDLTIPIEQKEIAGKHVFNIGIGALFICLSDKITTAVAEGIGKWKEEQQPSTSKVIFKDTGFTDVEKTNSMQILKRFGIEEINTI
jgi:adenine-specific DNA-methyltransferase